jgi:peptidoglycan hydrolase-like protein with peptidoglycan-binding domain
VTGEASAGEVNQDNRKYVRWVQQSLNRIMGLRLPPVGIMGPQTRSAIRSFQRRQGLPADGVVGPETKRALISARRGQASTHTELDAFTTLGFESEPIRSNEMEFKSVGSISGSDYLKWVQGSLNRLVGAGLKVNGLDSATYRNYVKIFQSMTGLKPNGEVDAKTQNALIKANYKDRDYIKWVQRALIITGVGVNLRPSGIMDRKTINAIKSFQANQGLKADGWVGAKTETSLVRVAGLIPPGVIIIDIALAFYKEYELRFNPNRVFGIPTNRKLTKKQRTDRIKDVNDIVDELVLRRDRRAAFALASRIPPPNKVSAALKPAAIRLSQAQLDLFREFFGGAGGINFKSFQFSFELFANGQLRDSARTDGFGEPDGGFYFLFAEFAFLCIDSGIDKADWEKALRTFVKTQEIFMHIYRPAPHPKPPPVNTPLPRGPKRRELDDFAFSNFNAAGQSDISRKKKLRAKYDKMSVGALKRATRDNLRRALRMP